MKRIIFISLFSLSYISILAQLRYPIQGTFQKKSAQGMAIHDDFAYLMNDGGLCRVLDLKKGIVIRDFFVDSHAPDNHINSACFGQDYRRQPLLYLSECKKNGRCFVECLKGDTSVLVQTIQATRQGKKIRMTNWVVDKEKNYLYALTRNKKNIDSLGNMRCHITKYRLPSVDEGKEVFLSEKDEFDKFYIIFPNSMQGCKIRGKYLYITTGLQQSLSNRTTASRAILVVDLEKKKISHIVDLTYVTVNEPEDIDFYNDKCLLYCGQEGGLYEIKVK